MFSDKDINNIRKEFPILKKKIFDNKLIYFDNAATTQKPYSVLKSIIYFYENINSNVHRANHYLGELATNKIENVRSKIQKFINAKSSNEIIFTKGTTDSINIIASSLEEYINIKDEIIISDLEHHSNIIPWQMICQKRGSVVKSIPIKKTGELDYHKFISMISDKTKIISICHISNVVGTINKIKNIIKIARKYKNIIIIDGAQCPAHIKIDVQNIDTDFYVFSSHKMYGPTGIGILYGKKNILKKMNPPQGGGQMAKQVSLLNTIYEKIPLKFEAGTPNISGIIGFGEAVNFIKNLNLNKIIEYEIRLTNYAINKLKKITNIEIYGHNNKTHFSSIISFNFKKFDITDISSILNRTGIALRTGYHCAQPLMNKIGLSQNGTIRISFSIYNTFQEIDILCDNLMKAIKLLK